MTERSALSIHTLLSQHRGDMMSFLSSNLFYCFLFFIALQFTVWFSTNLQFVSEDLQSKSFYIMLALSIPTSIVAYYGSKYGYAAFGGSVWSVRFFAFAMSYLIFPVLTWWLLGESMFTLKTMLCVALSFIIIAIQVWM